MKERNTIEIALKIANLLLLMIISTFLWMIYSQLASIPRYGDRYEEIGRTRPDGATGKKWNTPVVEVRGGEIEVSGGKIDVEVENRYPIEVKITN